MAKEKRALTPSQRKKRYTILQWSSYVGEFVAFVLPFFIIGIVNYDKYFVEYNGTKMSIAFFLAMGVMGFGIWGITKKKIENTYITLIIKWVIFAFIFTMLGEIIKDIAAIMWFGLIGIAGAYGLDLTSEHYKKEKLLIKDAEQKAKSDDLVEEVKQEKQEKAQKKIKVRIKK